MLLQFAKPRSHEAKFATTVYTVVRLCVPLERSMFDIAENALEIPFVERAHSRNVKYLYVSLVLLSQARPTFARERERGSGELHIMAYGIVRHM